MATRIYPVEIPGYEDEYRGRVVFRRPGIGMWRDFRATIKDKKPTELEAAGYDVDFQVMFTGFWANLAVIEVWDVDRLDEDTDGNREWIPIEKPVIGEATDDDFDIILFQWIRVIGNEYLVPYLTFDPKV